MLIPKLNKLCLHSFLVSLMVACTKQYKCEDLKLNFCEGLGYSRTIFPNMFGHESQDEARMELHQYWQFIENECSADLKLFLCTLFAPKCYIIKKIPPCRSLCLSARNGCREFMSLVGINWSDRFNCDNFPEDSGALCIPKKLENKINNCEPLKSQYCEEFIDDNVFFPNYFNHENQGIAENEIKLFMNSNNFKWSDISYNFRKFICSTFFPKCMNFNETHIPCRSLCEYSQKEYISITKNNSLKWLEYFECSKFPLISEENCIENTTDSLAINSSVVHRRCEPIKIKYCSNMPYRLTSVPNSFMHHTQEIAEAELNQFIPLAYSNCSHHMQYFLCNLYAPQCTSNQKLKLPCRSFGSSVREECEGALQQFGYTWPSQLKSENFPECIDDNSCVKKPHDENLQQKQECSVKSNRCQAIKSDICNDLPYNMTHLPNIFNQMSVYEAEIGIQKYAPLFKTNCSPYLKFLFCSVYMPICTPTSKRLKPCRFLCQSVRNSCSYAIRYSMGKSWPSTFDCDSFPEINDSDVACMDIAF